MRVAVFGAGALGSFLGARLSRRAEVVLIGRPSHVRAVRARGLRVEGLTRGRFDVSATSRAQEARDADLVLLTTKAYDTLAAAGALRQAGGRAPVLSLQNGLTNVPTLLRILGGRPILGGSTTHGVTFVGAGRVLHAGKGDTMIGVARGPASLAGSVARLFTSAGLPAAATRDLRSVLWRKAIVNAAINPLTALLRCPNGEILSRAEIRLLSQLAAAEAAAVAGREKARTPADAWEPVRIVLQRTASNISSMLQDVQAGRPTEIDSITGEIVRLARRHQVDAPVNASLLRLVRDL